MENWSRYETPRHKSIFAYLFTRLNIVLKIKLWKLPFSHQCNRVVLFQKWDKYFQIRNLCAIQSRTLLQYNYIASSLFGWTFIHVSFIRTVGLKFEEKRELPLFWQLISLLHIFSISILLAGIRKMIYHCMKKLFSLLQKPFYKKDYI